MATVTEIVGVSGSLDLVNGEFRVVKQVDLDPSESAFYFRPDYIMSLADIPRAGEYLTGTNFRLIAVDLQQSSSTSAPDRWIVTLRYSSSVPPGIDLESLFSGQSQDPEFRPPEFSWTTREWDYFPEVDMRGYRICNSAGDPPIPKTPHKMTNNVCHIRYFVRRKPPGLLRLVNCTNLEPIYFDDESADKQCALIRKVDVSKHSLEKGVIGRWIDITIEIGEPWFFTKSVDIKHVVDLPISGVDVNQSYGHWVGNFLDKGRRVYDLSLPGLMEAQNDDTTVATEPVLLDGAGQALSRPVAGGDEVYRIYQKHRVVSFNQIRFY